MVDEPVQAPVTSAAPALVAASTPASQPALSAPVVENAPAAPVVTETPAAPVVEAPVTPAAEPAASLLAAEPVEEKPDAKLETKAETKPEEKKPEAEKSVEGEKKPEIEAPLPTYEAFKLPENFKADDKALGEFSGLLGQLEIAKGDHKATQEVGQKLIDLFTSKLGEATTQMTDYYAQVHQQQVKGWQEELQKDPVIGGSGDRTVLEKNTREMARFLAKNAGTKEEVTAFRALMTQTGVGDAPALVRVINNLKAKIDRYENESAKMLPGTKPVPSVSADPGKGIMQKLYGKK